MAPELLQSQKQRLVAVSFVPLEMFTYLTTVPAKKRRLADARKPVEGSTGDNVQRALADAIKVTGVKPSTSQQAAAHSLARNTNVEKTLEVSKWTN